MRGCLKKSPSHKSYQMLFLVSSSVSKHHWMCVPHCRPCALKSKLARRSLEQDLETLPASLIKIASEFPRSYRAIRQNPASRLSQPALVRTACSGCLSLSASVPATSPKGAISISRLTQGLGNQAPCVAVFTGEAKEGWPAMENIAQLHGIGLEGLGAV